MPLKLLLLTLGQVLGGPEFPVQGQVSSIPVLDWSSPSAPAASSVASDTLALWHMDESSGAPVDSAGYDGGIPSTAFYGTVQASVGVFDGSRYFSGNTLVGTPSGVCTNGNVPPGILSALLTGDYTWSAWVYRGVSAGVQAYENPIILSDGAVNYGVSFGLSVNNSTNKMEFYWKIGSSSYESHASTASLPLGGWHHVAATVAVTGGGATRTVNIYLDGALDSTFTGWVKPYTGITTNVAFIGCAESGYYAWAGSIDEMAITARALSATEVLALYRQSGRWSSPPASVVGASPALTRASVGYYETSAGHVVNALSGELRCGYQGCLVEPGRTNQALYSAAFDNAAWGKYGVGTSAPSISANAGAAPDGTFSADQVTWPSGVAVGQASILEPAVGLSVTTGQNYTWSVWLKTTSGTASVYLSFDNSTGPVQPTLATASTTWTRFSITRNIGAGDLGTGSLLYPELAIDRRGGVESDQSGPVLLVWGAQLEQGDFATTNIPTTGTSVARASDVLSVSASGLINTKGGVKATFVPEWASASVTPTVFGSDTAAQLSLSVGSGVLAFKAGGSTISSASLGWTTFSAHSVVGNWTSTAGSLKVDGVQVNGSAATPSVTALYLGGTSTVGGGVALSRVKVCKGGCR